MSSSPAPEFDVMLRDFIASFASNFFANAPPQDHDEEEQNLVFTVFSTRLDNIGKDGPLPASKSAMDDLPTVEVTEEEDCAICLTEYGDAREAKEMPCKHRYHSDCIMKWLGIHGSCPVCRYEMPVDEEEKRRRDGSVGWHVMITVADRTPVGQPGRNDVDSSHSTDGNGSPIEDMDIDSGSNGDGYRSNMDLDDTN